MTGTQIEYLGFEVNEKTREYTLRAKQADGEHHTFTLAIANEAFLAHRVRYQDAPDICFLKLQREMAACGDSLPELHLQVTDAELEEYNASHASKSKKKAPKPKIDS